MNEHEQSFRTMKLINEADEIQKRVSTQDSRLVFTPSQ